MRSRLRGLRLGRLLSWALAVSALVFVAWMVPLRDRCWDPAVPGSTHVTVTRESAGCVLHLRTGDVLVDDHACAQLKCEPGVVSAFAHARLAMVAALLVLYGLGTLVWAARWRELLAFAGVDISLMHVWRVSIEAQAGGVLLPGGLGGDALRIAGILARPTRPGEARAPTSTVVASVILDRAIGISLIAGLAAVLGVASGGVGAGPLIAVLAAIPVAVVGGLAVLRRAPLHRVPFLSKGRPGRVVTPVLAYVRDPRALRAIASAAALSLVVAAFQLAVVRGLVFALGAAPTGEKWIYVGTAMAFIVGAVPTLPGGWGTTDAAYVFFFAFAGVGSGAALAVCLVFRLFWYVSGVAGAALHLAGSGRSAEARGDRPAREG